MEHLKERLNNPQVVRIYRNMIENASIDVVRQLYKNLHDSAEGHPKLIVLEEFFKARLGDE